MAPVSKFERLSSLNKKGKKIEGDNIVVESS